MSTPQPPHSCFYPFLAPRLSNPLFLFIVITHINTASSTAMSKTNKNGPDLLKATLVWWKNPPTPSCFFKKGVGAKSNNNKKPWNKTKEFAFQKSCWYIQFRNHFFSQCPQQPTVIHLCPTSRTLQYIIYDRHLTVCFLTRKIIF